MILCRKEYGLSAKEVQQLESTSETALIALGHYSMQQMSIVGTPASPSPILGYPTGRAVATLRPLSPSSSLARPSIGSSGTSFTAALSSSSSSLLPFSCYRLGRLLLGLRGLSMHCYESSVRAMFHEVTGDGLMEHFIIKL
ncbi:uncharacterized protein LOC109400362 [Aedes albopictus]|uniref:Uncharacterized protein n=1 Tax=Aedes albopictus TaxID=7160 RepID=A0ABM1YZX5_AEDAL